ncbi:MAG: redoxin domain-containing protein [Pirellulales bacterium]
MKAWESLVLDYPDDTHAAAWYVYQLWHDRNEVPLQSYATVDALLEKILAREPLHPAHHYRIHLWDEKRPKNALDAAAKCGPAAPNIAHMWHMPGHIYTKLKRFDDAAYHQEASARVDHRHMIEDGLMPYQIHNYVHNNEWLVRNLQPLGRTADALRISKNLLEIPRHPKMNGGEKSSAMILGRDRLWDVLTKNELWSELLATSDAGYFAASATDDAEEIRLRRYTCVAHAALGHRESAQQELVRLEGLRSALDAPVTKPAPPAGEKSAACDAPVKKDKREIERSKRKLDQALRHAKGEIAALDGDHKGALELLAKVDDLPKTRLARAATAAADHDRAVKLAREASKNAENEVVGRAELVAALRAKGDLDEAKKEFAALRKAAAAADLSLPALVRLTDFAKECEYPTDWRLAKDQPKEIGERPTLDSLGPLAWTPGHAADWSLLDHAGKSHALSQDYAGKPVVVLFYLGFGCLHCAEQLNTFGPLAAEYRAAGIELVAISTDTPADLKKSLDNAKQDGGFPFPLLSDSEKAVFKKYRCYDDFDNRAMHGTILIDARGRIRWQEIGPEPFTDAKFLLGEAQRLLKLPE